MVRNRSGQTAVSVVNWTDKITVPAYRSGPRSLPSLGTFYISVSCCRRPPISMARSTTRRKHDDVPGCPPLRRERGNGKAETSRVYTIKELGRAVLEVSLSTDKILEIIARQEESAYESRLSSTSSVLAVER